MQLHDAALHHVERRERLQGLVEVEHVDLLAHPRRGRTDRLVERQERLAVAALGRLAGARVVHALRGNDLAALCTVPGIGKKTAERIVLELKDRLGDLTPPGETPARAPAADEALQALINLGYGAGDADRAVRTVLAADGAATTAEVIRRALQTLMGRP